MNSKKIYLSIYAGEEKLKKYNFSDEGEYVIGNDKKCEILISDE